MRRRPMREGSTAGGRIVHVVLFFEILLVLAAVLTLALRDPAGERAGSSDA